MSDAIPNNNLMMRPTDFYANPKESIIYHLSPGVGVSIRDEALMQKP